MDVNAAMFADDTYVESRPEMLTLDTMTVLA